MSKRDRDALTDAVGQMIDASAGVAAVATSGGNGRRPRHTETHAAAGDDGLAEYIRLYIQQLLSRRW
jgi:hypothetical protein